MGTADATSHPLQGYVYDVACAVESRHQTICFGHEKSGVARAKGGGGKEKECTTECKSRHPPLLFLFDSFIVAAALAVAIGVALVPQWAGNDLVRSAQDKSNRILGDTAVIIMTTPYCIGTLIGNL